MIAALGSINTDMPSAVAVLAGIAGVTFFAVFLAWTEVSNTYTVWDELSVTPWHDHDAWQRGLDRLRGKTQMVNLVLTLALATSAAVALLACTLRSHLAARP